LISFGLIRYAPSYNSYQEAPVQPGRPEVQQPNDPCSPQIPEEVPQNDPAEVPQTTQLEIKPDETGTEPNQTEI